MNGYTGTISPPGIYVRALYDYEADDQTSLSFRQGDIIQVLTQLESGWWDGVVHGYRGWFPSNYCEFVNKAEAEQLDHNFGRESDVEESDTDYSDSLQEHSAPSSARTQPSPSDNPSPRRNGTREEAAFWIPQATPDGRLFYFNTLTGVSTVELPLESPMSSGSEEQPDFGRSLPRAMTRTVPEDLLGGYERQVNSSSTSLSARDSQIARDAILSPPNDNRRNSCMSDGASPATSMESLSLNHAQTAKPRLPLKSSMNNSLTSLHSIGKQSAGGNSQIHVAETAPRNFLDDSFAVPVTWARLVDDMKKAVERYHGVVDRQERNEVVRRVEDISDYLRLLLAAASGTTDNHSGLPSIIASNKALYPHFRNMMARFSKLVLSSHIAAADFSTSETLLKCLQEADAMMQGVYNFVEVARQQRGEEIARIMPGFVSGSYSGGSWQNNALSQAESMSTSFMDDDYEPPTEPNTQLQPQIMERMSDLRRLIVSGLRRLEERLVIQEKIITVQKHQRLSKDICNACSKLLELYRPFLASVESIDLRPSGFNVEDAKVAEYAARKQRVYVYVAELLLSCQAVAAPLADEWEAHRGETLEERVERVRNVSRILESSTANVQNSLQAFMGTASTSANGTSKGHHTNDGFGYTSHLSQTSTVASSRATMTSMIAPHPKDAEGIYSNVASSKVAKIFGETPMIRTADASVDTLEDMPEYLRLDHERQIQYDMKTDPPSIRGGTLLGLVEQLTRHDKFDSPFKTTFLLTYQSFTTASELFEALIHRWSIQPPPGLNKEELELWTEKKQGPIRFRIVNVMKNWVEQYWMEGNDQVSTDLISRMYNFARETVANSNTPGWKPLQNVVEQRMRGEDVSAKKLIPAPSSVIPLPILPKNMKKLKFTEIDPTEFARQLTIIESRLYGKIKPHECLNKIWQKKPAVDVGQELATNVKSLILHSNRLTNLVAEMILAQGELSKRANVVKHFIMIADKCLTLNNFSTLTSIISALGTAPIHRLNRTWAKLGRSTAATLEKMRRLMHSTRNFAPYRQALHQANPPCIPFFGVYLTDLTFIEDGMSSIIKKTDLINFSKRAKTAEVIREIQTYQNVSYPFKAVPELQDYILSMMQGAGDVHEMYDRSLAVEPREREDEKIARLLSESGFL